MNTYFDEMILSASPVELIRLLFQRAIAKVREARLHLRNNRIEERAAAINAAYRVVAELMSSIDPNAAPDLAQRLHALYCYAQERLLEANLKQTDAPLADVLGVLSTIAEAWNDLSVAPAAAPVNAWASAGLVPEDTNSFVLTA